MARHFVKPDDAPEWADYAFGLVFVPHNANHTLSLRTISLGELPNVEDFALAGVDFGEPSSEQAEGVPPALEDALTVINENTSNGVNVSVEIYKMLRAFFGAPVGGP